MCTDCHVQPPCLHITLGMGCRAQTCCNHLLVRTECRQSCCHRRNQDTDHTNCKNCAPPSAHHREPHSPLLSASNYPDLDGDWISSLSPTSSRLSSKGTKTGSRSFNDDAVIISPQSSKEADAIRRRPVKVEDYVSDLSNKDTDRVSGPSSMDTVSGHSKPLSEPATKVHSQAGFRHYSKPTTPPPSAPSHTETNGDAWPALFSPRGSDQKVERPSSTSSCQYESDWLYQDSSPHRNMQSNPQPLETKRDSCSPPLSSIAVPNSPSSTGHQSVASGNRDQPEEDVSPHQPLVPPTPLGQSLPLASPHHHTSDQGVMPYYVVLRPSRARPPLESFFERGATRWVLITWTCTVSDRSWDVIARLDKRATSQADIAFPDEALVSEPGVSRGGFIVVYNLNTMAVEHAQVATDSPPGGRLKARLVFSLKEHAEPGVTVTSEYRMTLDPEFPAKIKIIVS